MSKRKEVYTVTRVGDSYDFNYRAQRSPAREPKPGEDERMKATLVNLALLSDADMVDVVLTGERKRSGE